MGPGHPRGSREEFELPPPRIVIQGCLSFSFQGICRQCSEGAGGTEKFKCELRCEPVLKHYQCERAGTLHKRLMGHQKPFLPGESGSPRPGTGQRAWPCLFWRLFWPHSYKTSMCSIMTLLLLLFFTCSSRGGSATWPFCLSSDDIFKSTQPNFKNPSHSSHSARCWRNGIRTIEDVLWIPEGNCILACVCKWLVDCKVGIHIWSQGREGKKRKQLTLLLFSDGL